MLTLPPDLSQYWLTQSLRDKFPAYFQVTCQGFLIDWGGSVDRYSSVPLYSGQFVGEAYSFLSHTFPLQNLKDSLQWVETEVGSIVDIYFWFDDSQGWILLLETHQEALKFRSLMQQGNELKLLRKQYDHLLQGYLKLEHSDWTFQEDVDPMLQETPCRVSLVQIKRSALIHNFETAQNSSQDLLKIFNCQLQKVFQILIEEGGLIHHVFGQTVSALFGLSPSHLDVSCQAIDAAERLIAEGNAEDGSDHFNPQLSGSFGIAIATGYVTLGIRKIKHRQIFHMLGETLTRVETMQTMIQPGLILIDQNTYDSTHTDQAKFSPYFCPGETSVSQLSLYAYSSTSSKLVK